MAKVQIISLSLVVLLCASLAQSAPDDSFQDLMFNYYSVQDEESTEPGPRIEKSKESATKPAGEFGMTLSGMMTALADIQRRGDLMLEGVRIQAEKLDEINKQIQYKKSEYDELTQEVNRLREEKNSLTIRVKNLRKEKNAVVLDVEGHKDHMQKMQAAAEPLLNEINTKTVDLQAIEEKIKVKKQALIAAASGGTTGKTAIINQLTASEKAEYCVNVPDLAPLPIIDGSDVNTVYMVLFASVLGNVILGAPLLFSLIDQVSRSDMDLPSILTELDSVSPDIIKNLNKNLGPAVNQLSKNIQPTMNHFTKNLPAQMHKLNKNLKPAMSKMSKLNKNLTKNLTKNISNLKPSMDQLIKQNLRPTKDKAVQFTSNLLKKSSQVPALPRKSLKQRNYGQKTKSKMAATSAKPNMDELKFVADKLDNFEQRFKNRFVQDAYYNLPRSL